jgi:ABC-type oligopeptide transport system ATPase subunit
VSKHRSRAAAPAVSDDTELLSVVDLQVRLGRHRHSPHATVDKVSLTLGHGETLGIVGESGAGKSTLARSLVGLVTPCGGQILFEGRDITRLSRRARRPLARHIQYIFQDPYSSLNPARTIGDTLAEPLLALGHGGRAERASKIRDILDLVGLPAGSADRYPASFSGGQRQRIAIARALVVSPKLVICDEPTSALDVSIQAQILLLLRQLQQKFGISYLFITHNLDVVRYMADRTIVMKRGQIIEHGSADKIATDPGHPYTRSLIAAMPLPDPVAQAERRSTRLAQLHAAKPPPARAASTPAADRDLAVGMDE